MRDEGVDGVVRLTHVYQYILFSQLRGFYIKLGQIGSSRPDFVAPQIIEKLEILQVVTR